MIPPEIEICEHCRDRDGVPKQSYKSRKEAYYAIRLGNPREAMSLTVYPCPYEKVWHITRK